MEGSRFSYAYFISLLSHPQSTRTTSENYTKLCTISVDLSHLPLNARPKAKGAGSGSFFRLDYEIVLLFGLTELKAQVAWKEKQAGRVCDFL